MPDFIKPFLWLEETFEPVLTNFIISIIILLVGFVAGRVAGRVLDRVFKEIEIDSLLQKATGVKLKLGELTCQLITYIIYFVFIIAALDRLGIQTIALNIILGGFILLLFLMVILGIKDFIPNLIAGIFLHHKGFVNEGDKIKVAGIEGKIEHIDLVETKIRTKNGDVLFIPNSFLTKNQVLKLKKYHFSAESMLVTFNMSSLMYEGILGSSLMSATSSRAFSTTTESISLAFITRSFMFWSLTFTFFVIRSSASNSSIFAMI